MSGGEVRVTSSTGGAKGQKPQRMDLLPWASILKISEVFGFGAAKYADHNWRKGYAWSLNFAAAMRHMAYFWEGEDLDLCPEDCEEEKTGDRTCKNHSGLPHLAHAAWHMLCMLENMDKRPEYDDRYSTTSQIPETEVVTIHQKNPDVDFDVRQQVQRAFDPTPLHRVVQE